MTAAEKLKEATAEAFAEAEALRNAGDKLISLTPSPEGTLGLSASGRLFLRAPDPGHFNDGRTARKFRWSPVEGPFDA